MLSHRFRVGDKVRVTRSLSTNEAEAFLDRMAIHQAVTPKEPWVITRVLPADSDGFRYQLRSDFNGPDRVAREQQLELLL
jgi:hypothetical protein